VGNAVDSGLRLNAINNNSIQFNSYLFTCKLNSSKASYKVSTSTVLRKKQYKLANKIQNKTVYKIVVIIIPRIIIIIIIIP
jgi:hypothetical protein